jgi:hypothetical protein
VETLKRAFAWPISLCRMFLKNIHSCFCCRAADPYIFGHVVLKEAPGLSTADSGVKVPLCRVVVVSVGCRKLFSRMLCVVVEIALFWGRGRGEKKKEVFQNSEEDKKDLRSLGRFAVYCRPGHQVLHS